MNGMKIPGTVLFFLIVYCCQSQNLELVENKGQWNPNVKFEGKLLTGAFFLQPQGYKVLQHNKEDLQRIQEQFHSRGDETGGSTGSGSPAAKNAKSVSPSGDLVLRSHAYEVLFEQSNPNPEIIPEKPQPGYNNYFTGNDPSKWASSCKIYGAATYKNVYPGIDVRYYSDQGQLKYDIIAQPNADLSKLALKYSGADGLEIRNGNLIIKTSVGEITEQFPYSYQLVNGIRTQVISKFKLAGNVVRYDLGKYEKNKALVIDPTLTFASFTGSSTDNWGYTATYGPGQTMFGGGIAFGNGYPVSTGAVQTTFGGGSNTGEDATGYDIAIIKLSADGAQRIYATYIGGSGNEAPHSMITDAAGNLVVAGRTNSSNFPVRRPQIGAGGGWDIVVFKLNATGTVLTGSIKIGGPQDDGVNVRNKYPNPQPQSLMLNYGDDSRSEVIFDNSGNVILASCTQSANFPITPATAFQPVKAGPAVMPGAQDGLFLRFDPNLNDLIYGSFLGGSGDDAAYVLNSSPITGDIWIGGGTASNNFPGNKAGTLGPASFGNIDGFVAVVSAAGALLRSSYIGTPGNDQVYGLKFDIAGAAYVMGTSTGSFPVTNAAFSQPGSKQFIAKLQTDISGYVYSTVFGSASVNPNISPIAFLVDRCENVYISGWGGSITQSMLPQFANGGTVGMTTTPNAIQSSTDGRDFYFFVLERNAVSQLYGSFYGQNGGSTDHVDGGTSRFDENGVIYQALCANCGGTTAFPTTPGAWATSNGSGGGCNEALVKVEFNLAGINSGVKSSIARDGDTSGCVPLVVNFRDTIALGQSYEWNFGDGSGDFNTTIADISHTFTTVGLYRVRLIAVDSSKCFPRDTSFINIRIRQDKAILGAVGVKLPPCQSTTYRFTNTSQPYPGKTFSNQSFRWIWGDNTPDVISGLAQVNHTYPGIGTYNVKLVLDDTNFCNSPDTFRLTIRISPNVKAGVSTPSSGCAPYNAVFNNTSLGGTNFLWDFGDGTRSDSSSPTHLYATPGVYLVKLIATDTTTCNLIDSTNFTVTVSGKPTAAFSYNPNPAEENLITTFTNNTTGGNRYRWYYGDGDSIYTFRVDTLVRHQYNETKQFQPCLVALNQFNCPDTACQVLNAIVKPILDVPNAFTPNGDGTNDRAVVIGIGISRMAFKIYNRWGQLVFETNDRKMGWDGRYNGKVQPMDVYAYTLDAEFFDGKKIKKQGDITLLR